MPVFEMELHLPVKVFRRAPFIYTGVDSRSLILGAFSDPLTNRGMNLQRAFPLLVSSRHPDGRLADQLFSLAFLYIDDDERRRLHLTHPILLEGEGEALETLLSGANRIASTLGCASMDIEAHHEVLGSISFPSSMSPISYDLGKATLIGLNEVSLIKKGFRAVEEIRCLSADIHYLEDRLSDEKRSNEYVAAASPKEFKEIEKMCRSLPIRSYTLSNADATLNPAENIPISEGTTWIIRRRRRWGFGELTVEGFMRWSPNLFEAMERFRTPYLPLFQDILRYEYRAGKVFEWGFRSRDKGIILPLLSAAAEAMKHMGIETIQLGCVDFRQGFLKNLLEEYGFKVVHRIRLMRRTVEH